MVGHFWRRRRFFDSGRKSAFSWNSVEILLCISFHAGAIIVNYRYTVSPDLYGVPLMLLIILSAVIGGLGSLIGPLFMSIMVYLSKVWWLKSIAFGMINEEIILYVILILFGIFMPKGVYNEIMEKFRKKD